MTARDDMQPSVEDRVREVAWRLPDLPGSTDYVGSDLLVVHRGLARIRDDGLARGRTFCDWGSGLGGVCAVAALNGFRTSGIEIQHALVESARTLADEMQLDMTFAEGTFLLPGDEHLVAEPNATHRSFSPVAWDALRLDPADCDVVFAYPWPGEEQLVDDVFAHRASAGALLLTFHDRDYLLLQRKPVDGDGLALEPLGWI